MPESIRKGAGLLRRFITPDSPRIAIFETNLDCNRKDSCPYCLVPSRYRREKELTVDESMHVVDKIYDNGYRLLSYLGGEPFAPFLTKEGITFAEHTLQIIRYASQKGIAVNVVSNGDYLTPAMIMMLKEAGLDSLSLSLHSFTKNSLNHLISLAKVAAHVGIIPTITTVLTSENADTIPGIASHIASNGILYGFGLIQTKDKAFSTGRTDLIPSQNQLKEVAQALLRLKTFGFVRDNKNYLHQGLEHPESFYPNNWRCDFKKDTFLHIGAEGTIDVCSDFRTNLHMVDIPSLSASEEWRKRKKIIVENCGNCMYQCYFEAEHPDLLGDVPMFGVGLLIRTGRADFAEKWGRFAVETIMQRNKNINWNLMVH